MKFYARRKRRRETARYCAPSTKEFFVELMTGRRSFLTNLGEKADEFGIMEMMNQAGHTAINTALGYIHERKQQRKSKGGLFGVTRLYLKKKKRVKCD